MDLPTFVPVSVSPLKRTAIYEHRVGLVEPKLMAGARYSFVSAVMSDLHGFVMDSKRR